MGEVAFRTRNGQVKLDWCGSEIESLSAHRWKIKKTEDKTGQPEIWEICERANPVCWV